MTHIYTTIILLLCCYLRLHTVAKSVALHIILYVYTKSQKIKGVTEGGSAAK